MLIKSVKLHNIRSYTHQQIDFPDGSVLLAGDIGAGKSTVLLAIEFALFGIKSGELSGESLLRHGTKEGSVELTISIDGKEIKIKRALKRTKDSVKQDSGYIVIDGTLTEGTAIELKSKVYDLIGYPQSLISRSKDLIYRYTVYTPQEEMKQILYEDKDSRLDTMRRVFGIDKYKRIRENAISYARELRTRKKELMAKTFDLEDKKHRLITNETELKALAIKLESIIPRLSAITQEIESKKCMIEEARAKTKELSIIERELAHVSTKRNGLLEERKRNVEDLARLAEEITKLEKEASETADLAVIRKSIKDIEDSIQIIERNRRLVSGRLSEFTSLKRASEEVKEKIGRLLRCPTCEQAVGEEHKELIRAREDEKICSYDETIEKILAEESKLKKQAEDAKAALTAKRAEEMAAQAAALKAAQLKEKKEMSAKLLAKQETLKAEIEHLNLKQKDLMARADQNKGIEERWGKLEKEYTALLENEKLYQIQKESVTVKMDNLEAQIALLKKETAEKSEFMKQALRISEIEHWLSEGFMNLTTVMEKHVMAQIHAEFSRFFTEWFSLLIADDLMTVRIDDEFTPIIEQNGYETAMSNLSGGEKTSVALAYRLALNKVLNDMIGHIRTKDIIMLDEPTDGFSGEQLDKVRDLLDMLECKQTIIVSHEPKIESFVDSIIRITKEEHSSRSG